ncbi:MAG TPA: methylenetetrahydrofolate reductase C-terminal domain-containing protein [Myxococcota bacterium]|nr:methylenetetrahydrofolate reductase C-terminal domain-containing protein [Myxococcota bacterium]
MIVADLKPLDEIAASIEGFSKVLLLACGGCVTVCRTGGEAEAHDLARDLSHPEHFADQAPDLNVAVIERQCERDLVESYLKIEPGTDAVLSLGCGVGVQTLADVHEDLPIIPALSTTFMGAADEAGVWREKCVGCGDCLLTYTAGICPIARCAKGLLNGPCGGSRDGHCEVDPDVPCAWLQIYERLKRQGRLDYMQRITEPRDWRPAGHLGPRERQRRGIAPGRRIR